VAFTYLKVKSAKCLCLLPVVLVLIWLLKNLVLFTSLKRVSGEECWCCRKLVAIGMSVTEK